ncbi:20301_t:CDS:2 [Funneliformis geosporum]|uniref:8582_t:CDS:1 n=1 Tax=Funneliformis geosporum TaxID=1117311 RepID=A0A9W4SS46_9GLOM|nr:20301_t:CDS:2 [Funneliformis geosporum]CAI2178550.1 8582_t:CDS:2 [Funneliformis geosporum]
MASKLNTDCLEEIFGFLKLDGMDHETTLRSCILHPCILVNRQWCFSVVRLLWSNPWHFRKDLECVTPSIINTYISTFSKESKERLIENKIILPKEATTQPTFNYAWFLRNLHLFHLEMTLKSWFQSFQQQRQGGDITISGGICSIKYKLVFEELLNNFFRTSPCILKLSISAYDNITYLTNSIEQTPKSIDCLAYLRYFRSSGDLPSMPKLFSLLSNISPNLLKLQIDRYIITEELADLINAQKNLKEIFFHKHPSLRHRPLSLSNNKIAQMFSNFENLRELYIKICGGMKYTREELLPLAFISLNHLQKFFWHSTHYIYLDLFPNFFRNNGKHLKDITIKGFMISDSENAGLLINSVAKHCVNLRSFSGPILIENVAELTKLLENCNELQSLSLHPSRKKCYGPQRKGYFDDLMNVLIDQQGVHLSELILAYSWTFNIGYFERLMKKFERLQKKKFNFVCDVNILRDPKFDNIVNRFVELGILKEIDTGYVEFGY